MRVGEGRARGSVKIFLYLIETNFFIFDLRRSKRPGETADTAVSASSPRLGFVWENWFDTVERSPYSEHSVTFGANAVVSVKLLPSSFLR